MENIREIYRYLLIEFLAFIIYACKHNIYSKCENFQFECCGVEGVGDWTDKSGVFSNSYSGRHCGQDVNVPAELVEVAIRK